MTLYEINGKIREFLTENVDPETGEVLNLDALNDLELERSEKLESYALAIKNFRAAASAIKAEEDNLKARRERLGRTADRLSEILRSELNGEKMSTARVQVSYRRSKVTEIIDIGSIPDKFLKVTVEPKKDDIKAAINAGESVSGAAVVEKTSIIIK